MPAASSGPCSPTVERNARCASWPSALGAPGSAPASCVIASATVRCSCSGAEPAPSEKGTTNGLRSARAREVAEHDRGVERPVRLCRRSRPRRASPPLPPLVETSTIVRWVSRAANTRASSSSAAVPDSSAARAARRRRRGGRGSRSGVALVEPGRCAITRRAACARRRSSAPSKLARVHRESRRRPSAQPAQRAARRARRAPRRRAARAAVRETRPRGSSVRRTRARLRRRRAPASRCSGARTRAEREGGDREREHERHEGRAVQAPVEHRLDHSSGAACPQRSHGARKVAHRR